MTTFRPYTVQLGLMALHGGPWRGLASYRRFVAKHQWWGFCGASWIQSRERQLTSAAEMDEALNAAFDRTWRGPVSFKDHSYREEFYRSPQRAWRRNRPPVAGKEKN